MRADIKLYNMDCMEAMKDMPDNAFDLAIVDPPYGIGMDKNAGKSTKYKNKDWDKSIPENKYFSELNRVSKNSIIWGANYFGITGKNIIVWDKRECFIPPRTFADCEFAFCNFDGVARIFRHYWDGFLQKVKENRIHPTQKPVQLYKWLLQNYAKYGDKILDTHLGSGSIAIACWDLGFDLIGYEIDKDYYDAAVNRLKNHKKQGQLF